MNSKCKVQSAKLQRKTQNFLNPITIILFAVVLRLLPHPPNFAPIAAMALFGGAYLDRKYALLVPLIAMVVSDLFLGFHSTMPFVYGSFFLTGLIGDFFYSCLFFGGYDFALRFVYGKDLHKNWR